MVSLLKVIFTYHNYTIAVDCGLPDPPDPNGSKTVTNTTFNGRVKYACNKGFNLVGRQEAICQANGRWSSDAPACKRKCPLCTSIAQCSCYSYRLWKVKKSKWWKSFLLSGHNGPLCCNVCLSCWESPGW